MEGLQLLTEGQVFEHEVFAGTECTDHPTQKMPERHDHGKHLIGAARIEPVAKSFIVWVYEVLARHSGSGWSFCQPMLRS